MDAQSRLNELADADVDVIEQHNQDTRLLFKQLMAKGLAGDWRIEKLHVLGVKKPGVVMAIGDWYPQNHGPLPNGQAIAKQVIALINKMYPVNRVRTKTWGKFQTQYHFARGDKIIKVMVHYKPFLSTDQTRLGTTDNLITYIEVYFASEEEAWKPITAGRYLGTEQWFRDKELQHQKDYLTKKPRSRFKSIHQEHIDLQRTEYDAENTKRYTNAMDRLKERLNK